MLQYSPSKSVLAADWEGSGWWTGEWGHEFRRPWGAAGEHCEGLILPLGCESCAGGQAGHWLHGRICKALEAECASATCPCGIEGQPLPLDCTSTSRASRERGGWCSSFGYLGTHVECCAWFGLSGTIRIVSNWADQGGLGWSVWCVRRCSGSWFGSSGREKVHGRILELSSATGESMEMVRLILGGQQRDRIKDRKGKSC